MGTIFRERLEVLSTYLKASVAATRPAFSSSVHGTTVLSVSLVLATGHNFKGSFSTSHISLPHLPISALTVSYPLLFILTASINLCSSPSCA